MKKWSFKREHGSDLDLHNPIRLSFFNRLSACALRYHISPRIRVFAVQLAFLLSITTILCAAQPTMDSLKADFAQPPAQWKSRPLWFWNAPLDKSKTAEIMERSVASGYYGFGILPTKQMGVPFMSADFLSQYKHAVDTASRLGLKMCLYDEFWFPSGSAGGLLREHYPEALSKRLDLVETNLTGPAGFTLQIPNGELMAVVAMNLGTLERKDISQAVSDGKLQWQPPAGQWKVMLFVCVPDGAGGLVDYLDPEAVKKFASLTYERYYRAFPEHFGRTIDSAFYDEPTFHWIQGGRAWTPSFNRHFEKRHGFSPSLLYPALWFDIGTDTSAARNLLFGLRAELFSLGFTKTLVDWCHAHNIELTGHVDQEEIVNPVGLCGDLIKFFEHQPIPGLDQIFAYDRGSAMYKLISSAAVNYGRRRVMTECYGAIKLPVPNLYREAMDQFAKGVNIMVPHAVWYEANKITFPPELSYRTEPYASALPAYNEYIGRLQRILQQGRPEVDIAVLYPIAGLQAAYRFGVGKPYEGGVIPEWADYMAVGERLSLDLRQDFTYLHPEILINRCRIQDDILHLDHPDIFQDYRILILPGSVAISPIVLAKVKEYYDTGGKVIATTCLPSQSTEMGKNNEIKNLVIQIFGSNAATASANGSSSSTNTPQSPGIGRIIVNRNPRGGAAWFIEKPDSRALTTVLGVALPQPDVSWSEQITVKGGHLTYLHKEIDGNQFYFFANSSDTPVKTSIQLRGSLQLERWNPHTGSITTQTVTREGNTTRVQLDLPPVSSLFLTGKKSGLNQ